MAAATRERAIKGGDKAALAKPRPCCTLFPATGGPGAILHAGTHQIVSSRNPAVAGEPLEIYGAGTKPGQASGGLSRNSTFSRTRF